MKVRDGGAEWGRILSGSLVAAMALLLLPGPTLPAAELLKFLAAPWESAIQKFEAADAEVMPPRRANVFVGSSSVRLWSLEASFPDRPCINRGFGGARFPDVLQYVDRIVTPYDPAVVVLYCGDNDLAFERTPEQIRDDYRTFVSAVHAKAPAARIVWVSIKPSPKRWALRDLAQEANNLVKASQKDRDDEIYVDTWTPMLGTDGTPRPELYAKDNLHLSEAGYALWADLVRPTLTAAVSPAEPSR